MVIGGQLCKQLHGIRSDLLQCNNLSMIQHYGRQRSLRDKWLSSTRPHPLHPSLSISVFSKKKRFGDVAQLAIMQKTIYPNLAIYQICNPPLFLATYWNFSLKSGNLKKIPYKSANLGQIFSRKSFYSTGQNYIFQVGIWQKFVNKRKTALNSPELKGERKSDIP